MTAGCHTLAAQNTQVQKQQISVLEETNCPFNDLYAYPSGVLKPMTDFFSILAPQNTQVEYSKDKEVK